MTIKPTRTNHFKVFRNGETSIKVREGIVLWYPMDRNHVEYSTVYPQQPSNVSDFGNGPGQLYTVDEQEFSIFDSCQILLKITFSVSTNSERAEGLVVKTTPYSASEFAMLKYKTLHSPTFEYVKESADFDRLPQNLTSSYVMFFKIADVEKDGGNITIKQRHSNILFIPKIRHYIDSANII